MIEYRLRSPDAVNSDDFVPCFSATLEDVLKNLLLQIQGPIEARASIDSGAALRVLDAFVAKTQSFVK